MRTSQITRSSRETTIVCDLSIEGSGKSDISTPIGFLSHMLEAFNKHGAFDLKIKVEGDLDVDQHHTVEDTGIVLGQAFKKALGDMKGINRAGSFAFPMDESLGIVAVDIAGRSHVIFNATFSRERIGELDTHLIQEFFEGFAIGLGANIAIYVPYGRDDHHKTEAVFKSFARALQEAVEIHPRRKGSVTSTKDIIDFVEHESRK